MAKEREPEKPKKREVPAPPTARRHPAPLEHVVPDRSRWEDRTITERERKEKKRRDQ